MPYLGTRVLHLRHSAENHGGEALNRYNSVRLKPPPEDKYSKLDHGPDRYKYKFNPAPRQDDQVIRYIKLAIRELNKEHIQFANMNFRVVPTDKSPPFWPPYPDYPTYCSKLYTFLDDYNEFPLTAWVTFFPRAAGLTTETLYFKIGLEWVSVKQWLLSKQSPETDVLGEKGYKVQRKWWKLIGMKFRLMDLPADVRLIIFEHALGPRLYPLSTVAEQAWLCPLARQNAAVHWGVGFYNGIDRQRGSQCSRGPPGWLFSGLEHTVAGTSVCEPNVALFQLSKQIRQEALQAGWENTRKCFFTPRQFTSVLDASHVPTYNWLNKIILDFTMFGWFEFFGIQLHPDFRMDTSECLRYLLAKLRNLAVLKIWFRSPEEGWDFSPFSGGLNTQMPYVCCQRVIADWIMTFAWPFVKDLPKVIVGGALKKDSKLKWDGLLSLPKASKVSVIDQVAEEAAIFNIPPALL